MAENTKIEWATHTFNPWEGCQKVGPGCDHCYAEARDQRFTGGTHWGPGAPRRRTSPANWAKPIKWNREAAATGTRPRVFCASLADVFDNAVDPAWRADLWALIARTPYLDWLLLTKRPGNIAGMLPTGFPMDWGNGLPNVWLGCTVVNQAEADRDIPKLLAVPAVVRFLSIEPLLGPVNINTYLHNVTVKRAGIIGPPRLFVPRLDWIICGGESGPHARPMHLDWARDLRDECEVAGVPFHFKQWGEWAPITIEADEDGNLGAAYPIPGCSKADAHKFEQEVLFWQRDQLVHWHDVETPSAIGARRIGKHAAGRLLDGREWNEAPHD